MKNILKYTSAAAAMMLALSSCEEMVDYQTVIDAAPKLAYVNPKGGDTFETLVVHRPTGSEGSFETEFQVNANSTAHAAVGVDVVYDAELVASYNEAHGTAFAALPREYINIENASVVIPENAAISADTVRLRLSQDADLSKLTQRGYLAPLKVTSEGLGSSEKMGNLWFIVNTEISLIRPVSSVDDMVGFLAGGTSGWTADCGNAANLFDGSDGTGVAFTKANGTVVIDMQKPIMVTGLKLNLTGANGVSIEYSEDGKEWSQAGTPLSGEYLYTGRNWYVAVYDYFTARYLRLTVGNNTINEVGVYMIESSEPTVYATIGNDNVVAGKIVHKKGVGSTSDFSASFKAYTTIASASGYNVNLAVDNSLVAAYNQKHGTSYKAMPSANVDLKTTSVSIAANDNASASNAEFALKGDLSGLTDVNGYLIPVRLSASGAVVSESRGVVYAIITPEVNMIRAISSADEMVGFPAGGRSSWSGSADGSSKLFDDDDNTSVNFQSSGNVLTVNMADTHLVTGLRLHGYGVNNVSVEFSRDGVAWTSAGTVAEGEAVWTGSSWSQGDWYLAFSDYLDAQYLRLSFGFSGYYRTLSEFYVYEIESTEPTVYTICGTDNVFTGKVVHHAIAGSNASLDASFNVMTTVTSPSGYSVGAEVNSSLVASYNASHNTKYAALDASYVEISGVPCEIGPGANKSAGKISVSLKGDISKLKNAGGYLLPVQLKAPAGAVVSSGRGVVYIVIEVEESTAVLRSGFSISDIEGTQVADRSGWKLIEKGTEIHSGDYDYLLDGDTETYIRTWGGPIVFTVDLGREYDVTGLVITARTDSYSNLQPSSISIRASLDDDIYEDLGTASKSEGTIVSSNPSSYVSFYGHKTVRYLKIEAGYGSNMGTAEFNIYAK